MKLAFNAAGFGLGSGLWPWECFLGVGLLWLVFGMAWLIRGFSSSVGGLSFWQDGGGCWALILWGSASFRMFPSFLGSWVLGRSATYLVIRLLVWQFAYTMFISKIW